MPTPNRASLMQLAVLFLRLGLTALVAINAGLLLRFCVNAAWLVLGGAVMGLSISALGIGGRRR